MQVKYDLVVDFARPTKSNTIIIAEGDANSRVAHFVLLANKVPMQMTDVTVATVKAIKDDGSVIYGDATFIEDDEGNKLNEIEYTIPSAMTDYAGNVAMTITLMSATHETITSWEFYIKVRNALYNEDDYVSESDLSGFRDLLNRSEAAVKRIEEFAAANSLPNPFPLNINLEGEDIVYTGKETVDISLNNMAYVSEEYTPTDAIDESAASVAVDAARRAKESSDNANAFKGEAELSAISASESAALASSAKTSAENYAGQSEAYRNQCMGFAELAQKSDWNQTNPNKYDYIKNKPEIPKFTSALVNDSSFIVDENYEHVDEAKVAEWGFIKEGGSDYSEGDGIDITDNTISVDNTIARKEEVPTNMSDLFNDSNFVVDAYYEHVDEAKVASWGFSKGGSGGDGEHIDILQADYDALSDAEKNDPNKYYFITDGENGLADTSIVSDKWTQRTYSAGEYCIDYDTLWKCLVPNSERPSEGANWHKTNVGNELKPTKPDYGHPVTILTTNNQTYTCNEDGYLRLYTNGTNGSASLRIDDSTVIYTTSASTLSPIPVFKGSVVQLVINSGAGHSVSFFPAIK